MGGAPDEDPCGGSGLICVRRRFAYKWKPDFSGSAQLPMSSLSAPPPRRHTRRLRSLGPWGGGGTLFAANLHRRSTTSFARLYQRRHSRRLSSSAFVARLKCVSSQRLAKRLHQRPASAVPPTVPPPPPQRHHHILLLFGVKMKTWQPESGDLRIRRPGSRR